MLSASMNEKLNAQITREFYSSYLYRQMASCLDQMGLSVLEQFFLDSFEDNAIAFSVEAIALQLELASIEDLGYFLQDQGKDEEAATLLAEAGK